MTLSRRLLERLLGYDIRTAVLNVELLEALRKDPLFAAVEHSALDELLDASEVKQGAPV